MAKENTEDWFGFAWLSDDFIPPSEQPSELKESDRKDADTVDSLEKESVKGVEKSPPIITSFGAKSVPSVTVCVADNAGSDAETQSLVQGTDSNSGSVHDNRNKDKQHNPKVTPPPTPTKVVGAIQTVKTSPRRCSSAEFSPINKCSVVIKKNPVLENLPRQSSYENVFAYVNDKIEIKNDPNPEKSVVRERKISSSESESSDKSVSQQLSNDKKADQMVYNADIEVRKSGRLKSAKCSSRYRGDYGIRAEVYTKLTSLKSFEAPNKSDVIKDTSEALTKITFNKIVDSENASQDNTDEAKTEEAKQNSYFQSDILNCSSDKAVSKESCITLQKNSEKLCVSKQEFANDGKSKDKICSSIKANTWQEKRLSTQIHISKIGETEKQVKPCVVTTLRSSAQSVCMGNNKTDIEEGKKDSEKSPKTDKHKKNLENIKTVSVKNKTGIVKHNANQKENGNRPETVRKILDQDSSICHASKQEKTSVIQTGRNSAQIASPSKFVNVENGSTDIQRHDKLEMKKNIRSEESSKQRKEINISQKKIQNMHDKKSENITRRQEQDHVQVEKNSNVADEETVKKAPYDSVISKKTSSTVTRKQDDNRSSTKNKQKNLHVKKRVGPILRTSLTLQTSAKGGGVEKDIQDDALSLDITGCEQLNRDNTHTEQKLQGSGYASVKNESNGKNIKKEKALNETERTETESKGPDIIELGKSERLSGLNSSAANKGQVNMKMKQNVVCDNLLTVPLEVQSKQSGISGLKQSSTDTVVDHNPQTSDKNKGDSSKLSKPSSSFKPVYSVSKSPKDCASEDRIEISTNSGSSSCLVSKSDKAIGTAAEKKIESQVKQDMLVPAEKAISPSSEKTLEDTTATGSSVSLLESLRLRLFANAGIKPLEVVDKPKVFESKIKEPRVKNSPNSNSMSCYQSSVDNVKIMNKTFSDNESNKSGVVSSKSSYWSGHSTPRSSSPSSEILDEVSKKLEGLQKARLKSNKSSNSQKPKRPRFSQKMFMLRSMIPKQTESDCESHSSVTTENSEGSLKDIEDRKTARKEVEGNTKLKKKHVPPSTKEKNGSNSKTNVKSVEKPLDRKTSGSTSKTSKDNTYKQLVKPKPAKCHACGHVFKNKELLRKHYPCRMRQTRTWSQNKLRPNRVFRYVEKPPREQGSKRFICLLPKSRKHQEKRRPQLLTVRKTKFKRVKGKRRRKLYLILQGLAEKRQPKTYPHLCVNYDNLTAKSQFFYKLGLFAPESVDHSSLRDKYNTSMVAFHPGCDQNGKENSQKLLSKEQEKSPDTKSESRLSLSVTLTDHQDNIQHSFEAVRQSDLLEGKQKSPASETEAPPVLEMFEEPSGCETVPNKDAATDSDSSGPPLLELQFESPGKKTHKERHFLDFVESIATKDSSVNNNTDDSDFKLTVENVSKLKEKNNKIGGAAQRHFTDFIDISNIKTPELQKRAQFSDSVLKEQSERGDLTFAEIREILKPKSRQENAFSKESLLKLRSDLAKFLADIKTPVKKNVNVRLQEMEREPSVEKSGLDKLGIDFSAYERKSLFETLENVDPNSFERQISYDDISGSCVEPEIPSISEHPDPYKSSPEYEQDLLPPVHDECDSLDNTTKGFITDNILQMLSTLEDKGSVAENMSNLLQILAENLGIISSRPGDISQGSNCTPSTEESYENADRTTGSSVHDKENNKNEAEGSTKGESTCTENTRVKLLDEDVTVKSSLAKSLDTQNVPETVVSDSAVELDSEPSGQSETDLKPQSRNSSEIKHLQESSLFKSITELNSIETDTDSNLGDSYDAEMMSKKLAELKATNYDASASDVNSDILSDSENALSEQSQQSNRAIMRSQILNKHEVLLSERPVVSESPTAVYDSDILESEEEIDKRMEERPRLIMKIKLPAGASFQTSDDSFHKDSSSGSLKSSDASDIDETAKFEDDTLVDNESETGGIENNTLASQKNKNIFNSHENVQENTTDLVRTADIQDEGTVSNEKISITIPEGNGSLQNKYDNEVSQISKYNMETICDNEIMFPRKLKLNTALTIGDSFDYESDSTSSLEREVTVVPRVGISPKRNENEELNFTVEVKSGDRNVDKNGDEKDELNNMAGRNRVKHNFLQIEPSKILSSEAGKKDIDPHIEESGSLFQEQCQENFTGLHHVKTVDCNEENFTDSKALVTGIETNGTIDQLKLNFKGQPNLIAVTTDEAIPQIEFDLASFRKQDVSENNFDIYDTENKEPEERNMETNVKKKELDNASLQIETNTYYDNSTEHVNDVSCSDNIMVEEISGSRQGNISTSSVLITDPPANGTNATFEIPAFSNMESDDEFRKSSKSTAEVTNHENEVHKCLEETHKKSKDNVAEKSHNLRGEGSLFLIEVREEQANFEIYGKRLTDTNNAHLVGGNTSSNQSETLEVSQQVYAKPISYPSSDDSNLKEIVSTDTDILEPKCGFKSAVVKEGENTQKSNESVSKKHSAELRSSPAGSENISDNTSPIPSETSNDSHIKHTRQKTSVKTNTQNKSDTSKYDHERKKCERGSHVSKGKSKESKHKYVENTVKKINIKSSTKKTHENKKTAIDTKTTKDSSEVKQSTETCAVIKTPINTNTANDSSIQTNVSKGHINHNTEEIINDDTGTKVEGFSKMVKDSVANSPIPTVIADENQCQVRSILKGSSVCDDSKEQQNKKRRISFTDYLTRVKKGDQAKKSEEQKQTKVPFTLHDENKSKSENGSEIRQENSSKSDPEIVVDVNMYQINPASETWHSFINIKRPQKEAAGVQKERTSQSSEGIGVSGKASFDNFKLSAEDVSAHKLDKNDSETAEKVKTSGRYISMPLIKNSDIITLEKTLTSTSPEKGTLFPNSKPDSSVLMTASTNNETHKQDDDVLSVFDSLFSLGETVLNLKKSEPKSDTNTPPNEEEGNLFSALDTLCKVGEDIISSRKSAGEPKTFSKQSKKTGPVAKTLDTSKQHIPEIIDLTEPNQDEIISEQTKGSHRPLFTELEAWVLQSGNADNINTKQSNDPYNSKKQQHTKSVADSANYLDRLTGFSGIYLNRFRYNVSAFEDDYLELRTKLSIKDKMNSFGGSPITKAPDIFNENVVAVDDQNINAVDADGSTNNHHEEEENSSEHIDNDFMDGGNEDYMDDDYADMLAAAQLALKEEAMNQTVETSVVEKDRLFNESNETVSVERDEMSPCNEEVSGNSNATTTDEALEILNNLVETLSSGIKETVSESNETAIVQNEEIDSRKTDTDSSKKEEISKSDAKKDAGSSQMAETQDESAENVDFINLNTETQVLDDRSCLKTNLLASLTENIESLSDDKMEMRKDENMFPESKTTNDQTNEKVLLENYDAKEQIIQNIIVKDSETLPGENAKGLEESMKENALDSGKVVESSQGTNLDLIPASEIPHKNSVSNEACTLEFAEEATSSVEVSSHVREQTLSENLEKENVSKTKEKEEDSCKKVDDFSVEKESSAKIAGPHCTEMLSGIVSSSSENEDNISAVFADSEDVSNRIAEVELLESQDKLIQHRSPCTEEVKEAVCTVPAVSEEKFMAAETQDIVNMETRNGEKGIERKLCTLQNSLVSMDYDTVSDGSFSEDDNQIRQSDKRGQGMVPGVLTEKLEVMNTKERRKKSSLLEQESLDSSRQTDEREILEREKRIYELHAEKSLKKERNLSESQETLEHKYDEYEKRKNDRKRNQNISETEVEDNYHIRRDGKTDGKRHRDDIIVYNEKGKIKIKHSSILSQKAHEYEKEHEKKKYGKSKNEELEGHWDKKKKRERKRRHSSCERKNSSVSQNYKYDYEKKDRKNAELEWHDYGDYEYYEMKKKSRVGSNDKVYEQDKNKVPDSDNDVCHENEKKKIQSTQRRSSEDRQAKWSVDGRQRRKSSEAKYYESERSKERKGSKVVESGDNDYNENEKLKTKKSRKSSEDRKGSNLHESNHYQYEKEKKKNRKESKIEENSDSEDHGKDRKHKIGKFSEARYSKDSELEQEVKTPKRLTEENKDYKQKSEQEKKKDRKSMSSSECRHHEKEEKEKRGDRKWENSSENRYDEYDVKVQRRKKDKESKESQEMEYEEDKERKKERKKRKSGENEDDRFDEYKAWKRRKVSEISDDDDYYMKHKKKKKKNRKHMKSSDSEGYQYIDYEKDRRKDKKKKKWSETKDYEIYDKRDRKHSHREHGSISPDNSHSWRKGKMLQSAVVVTKREKHDKDNIKSTVVDAKSAKHHKDKDKQKDYNESDIDELKLPLKSRRSSR